MLNWLLIFVPVAIALEFFAPGSPTLIFGVPLLAVYAIVGMTFYFLPDVVAP